MIVTRALAASALALAVYSAAVAQELVETPRSEPVRYSYILAGELAGTYERTALPDRAYRLRLEYRSAAGTALVETLAVFDAQWRPTLIETAGHDATGRDMSETFAIDDGIARWKNRAERGAAPARPLRFYASAAAPLDETRALVLAARAGRDGCVDLLPSGRACVRKALEDNVTAGEKSRTVHAWSVSGIGFRPIVVWLDEKSELFAVVSPWASAIREGWEPAEDSLLDLQEAWVGAELRRRSVDLKRRPSRPFMIRNARLFDAVTGQVRPGMSVLVEGTQIVRVAPDRELAATPAEIVEARGAMLLPGLWDMHVHGLPADGLLALAAGVTTVRSLGGRLESLVSMRQRFDRGELAGPRLLFHGLIDGRNDTRGVTGELIASAFEARMAVDHYLEAGADGIKLYSSLPRELVSTIIDAAHGRGLVAGGHVPAGMSVQEAVRSGFDEVNHLWVLMAAFDAPMPDRHTIEGKNELLRRVLAFDPKSPAAQAFFSVLRERQVTIEPTIGSFEDSIGIGGIVNGEDPVHGTPLGVHLPPAVRRSATATHRLMPVDEATRITAVQRLRATLAELRRAGVRLVIGGDGLPGIALQREMAEWAASGVPNAEILQAATLGNARAARREKLLGSIEAGKLADMILVDGDPLANIRDIAKVRLTIKDGAIYDSASMLRAIGVER